MTKTPGFFSIPAIKAIVLGGFLSGFFDLMFAFAYYGNRGATPISIMQSIAAGLIGKNASFQGGTSTALLGLMLHFVISSGATGTYYTASRHLPFLTKNTVLSGLLFGAAVYFFMNMVVMPLSAYHTSVFPPPLKFAPILAHMLGVGLPIAFATRRYSQ